MIVTTSDDCRNEGLSTHCTQPPPRPDFFPGAVPSPRCRSCFTGLHAWLGHREEAIRLLQKAVALRASLLVFRLNDPEFDSLRSDPRFRAVAQKVGLPYLEELSSLARTPRTPAR